MAAEDHIHAQQLIWSQAASQPFLTTKARNFSLLDWQETSMHLQVC